MSRIAFILIAFWVNAAYAVDSAPADNTAPAISIPVIPSAPAAVAPPAAPTVPAPALAPTLELDAAPKAPAPATAHQEILNDDTPIFIDADQTVYIINADGSKTPAPDGPYTLKYGITMSVQDGKRAE